MDKSCDNCKHEEEYMDNEPCASCSKGWTEWEPKEDDG